ncbi:MAG: hypothetical protein HC800_18660 [Phormidesmis sp. RL_2_1]|nr:hypothetical protein [Phormidesmis sp. RL_2_1]
MKSLKPLIGFALVVAVIMVGFVEVSQWLVFVFGVLFTAAYINGKWPIWADLFGQHDGVATTPIDYRKLFQCLLATYAVETIIVFALYWLGRGTAGLL